EDGPQLALLLEDPSLIPGAVEESLRMFPAFAHFRRTASSDTELHGQKIKRGEKVVMWYASSNRDESRYEDPDRFDVRRNPEHQALLVAEELEPVADELRAALGLHEPFRDPGVAAFGLTNVVFALGDCFLEVVSPAQPETAAGRYLARHGGDGGYMVMFDLEDLDEARQRAESGGIRVVWRIDLPDISGTHLHPADMRGAIVSIDSSRPYGSWRWGGPEWTGRIGHGAPGRLSGITVAVADPPAVAAR